MDRYAAESFQRAEAAQKAGLFDDEIVPVTTKVKTADGGEWKQVTLTKDEGIRPGTTLEGLAKVRPAFPQWGGGTTTGGSASQVTDGGKLPIATLSEEISHLSSKSSSRCSASHEKIDRDQK